MDMIMIKHTIHIGLCLLLTYSLPSMAENIYRYTTPEGSKVVSHILPPNISQSGYDILDGQTMRLIRHVEPALTDVQIAAKIATEKEKRAQLENEKEQLKKDAEFLEIYHSEESLIKDRDHELNKRDKELLAAKEKQTLLLSSLHNLQQRAAEQELNGADLSKQLQKNLTIVAHNIKVNQEFISRLEEQNKSRKLWYKMQLKRLKQLLASQ